MAGGVRIIGALLAADADAGAFRALVREDVGMAAIGVAPARQACRALVWLCDCGGRSRRR